MLGTEGIAVGMATRILPHNFGELLKAQIAILRGEKAKVLPGLPAGRPDGRLRVRGRPRQGAGARQARDRARQEDDRDPRDPLLGTTTETRDRVDRGRGAEGQASRSASIEDRTGREGRDRAQARRAASTPTRSSPQLYAYTECEVSIVSSPIVIDDDRPVEMTVSDMLERLTERLREQIKAELELRAVRARATAALPHARADLHREPGLPAHREGEDRRGGAQGGVGRACTSTRSCSCGRWSTTTSTACSRSASGASPPTTSSATARTSRRSRRRSRRTSASSAGSPTPPSPTSRGCSRSTARSIRGAPRW